MVKLTPRRAILLILLAPVSWGCLAGAMFVYGRHRTTQFRASQADAASRLEIELDGEGAPRVIPITDPHLLRVILDPLKQAEYTLPNHPHKEQTYYVRVHRRESRVDEYEILLDSRGAGYDLLHVVHREGRTTHHGSAFKTPGLRKPLLEVLAAVLMEQK
jgi:hypothetical protein